MRGSRAIDVVSNANPTSASCRGRRAAEVIDALLPDLSLSTQALVRAGYGVLMLLTLAQALPNARRFFLSERWGGYAKSSRDVDAVQNPLVLPVLLIVWFGAALAIVFGWAMPWAALVNLVLCRYFFIHMRWKGILRGMGAPGFIAYWVGFAVFLLEYTARFAPNLRPLALLVLQVDLALIILSAGVYKFTAGYARNHGMELGMANPMWGYWWRHYITLPPNNVVYWTLNQLAWGTEVVAALLMLVPPTRELGGLLLSASFVFILTQIRLGFLCEMGVLAGLLYVVPGSLVDGWIAAIVGMPTAPHIGTGPGIAIVNAALGSALIGYLALLPLAHAGLYYNFYARRSLPRPVQRLLERYTNLFGIIIWRVFSVDLVNFFIHVHAEPAEGGARTLVGRLGTWPRFNHVGEMICITSLFTTLKYYPADDGIFRERLQRYARTIARPPSSVLVFEYISVVKRPMHFDWVPVAEYRVDVDAGTVSERLLDKSFSPRAAHAVSPVHAGAVPGSYAPASR
jgi:hypothetical protein